MHNTMCTAAHACPPLQASHRPPPPPPCLQGAIVAIENAERNIYGFQFHPEVTNTDGGMQMVRPAAAVCCAVLKCAVHSRRRRHAGGAPCCCGALCPADAWPTAPGLSLRPRSAEEPARAACSIGASPTAPGSLLLCLRAHKHTREAHYLGHLHLVHGQEQGCGRALLRRVRFRVIVRLP